MKQIGENRRFRTDLTSS